MLRMLLFATIAFLCVSQTTFSQRSSTFSPLGHWRGEFQLRPNLVVPFNFEISQIDTNDLKVYFINADERFEAGYVKQKKDSLFIYLDQFQNELAFRIEGNVLSGVLRKQDGTGTSTPVKAAHGIKYRFKESDTLPTGNISGTYEVVFKSITGKEEKAVGLFQQEGKKLKGTFLRVTGDSRYLEGIVEGNRFYLSSFIGSGPAYYKGSFNSAGKISGEMMGSRITEAFTAIPNEDAVLPDPYKLTLLKNGYTSLDFSFPDENGRWISIKDKKFHNKVVIVTISGTWCPNCIDEAAFLAPWYKTNRKRGVEIISIHYERQTDSAFVKKVLSRFRDRFNIEYDQVFAGKADQQFVATSLPALNSFLSFPTTILVDKKGKVTKIHTGFTGPATGKYYTEFISQFNKDIDALLEQ